MFKALISRLQVEWSLILPLAFAKGLETRMKRSILSKFCRCKIPCSESWLFFHDFETTLNDVKSVDELDNQIIALIKNIWLTSHAQELSPCMLRTVRECIKACKRAELLISPLFRFYDFQMEGKSLLAGIILHSLSDSLYKARTRHRLLQMILDELPLTVALRDELYLACAETGFNHYFKRIRLASLKWCEPPPVSQGPSESHSTDIRDGLKSQSKLGESVTVVPNTCGFQLTGFVPDMLQRLRSGSHIGTEFLTKGQVWGIYISVSNWLWKIALRSLQPPQTKLEGKNFLLNLRVSPHDEYTAPSVLLSSRRPVRILVADLPAEDSLSHKETCWIFNERESKYLFEHLNRDGGGYLTIDVQLPCSHDNALVKGHLETTPYTVFRAVYIR